MGNQTTETVSIDLRAAFTELFNAIDAYSAAVWNSDMKQETDRYNVALRRAREALSALDQSHG